MGHLLGSCVLLTLGLWTHGQGPALSWGLLGEHRSPENKARHH